MVIRARLAALGYEVVAGDTYDTDVVRAVQAFQVERGLALRDGIDTTTWLVLEETSWRLGDRLLFVGSPYLRGDDVVVLQQSLSLLGFDPGRVDGIFGPLTETALADFQANVALTPDGTLTMATLRELERLAPRDTNRRMVSEVRQRVDLIREATTRRVGLGGHSPLLEQVATAISQAGLEVVILSGSDEQQAEMANDAAVGVALFLSERAEFPLSRVYFYESYRFRSLHGAEMSAIIARALGVEASGMGLPVLRQTTMTALAITHPQLSVSQEYTLINGISASLAVLFNK
ncbi:MAG: peptidoglycan-binding domain-containing protein [Actinomycetes bacterium]